jgi:F-type H+-transporting ATPase subunit delta
MKTLSLALARRYARALLDVAHEHSDPARVREELRELRRLLEQQRELAEALAHPALAAEKKRGLLQGAFGGRLAPPVLRLLELLVERRRSALLPAIEQAYAELFNARRGVAAAEAVSARALEAPEREALKTALERASGLGIELEERVDPALLGGLLVRLGGRSYDGSVRQRLHALRERLRTVGPPG